MNPFIKDLVSVLKSRVTVLICGIATSILTARYLGPTANGIISTLTVYPEIFITIGARGISQAAVYFIGQKKYKDSDVFSSLLYVWLYSSIFCLALCFVLLKYFIKSDFSLSLILISILPIPFSFFNTYSSGLFLAKNDIKEFNKVNWIPNVVRLFGTILLVVIFQLDVLGALIAIVVGYLILTFFVTAKVKKIIEVSFKYDGKIIRDLLKLGSIYAISLIVITLNYQIDIVLLEKFSSPYEIGIYTKGVSVAQYLWEIPTLLSTLIFARSAIATEPREFSLKVCLLLRLCISIIFVLSIIFFFLSGPLMVLLYGNDFYPSSIVQKLIIPGILLLTIFKVLNMDLTGKGKPWIAMKALIPSLVVNILLNILWDREYGANGAALASTLSYSLSAILFLFYYSKEVKIPFKEIFRFSISDFQFLSTLFEKVLSKRKNELNTLK